MKKLIFGLVGLVVILASCSNPASSVGSGIQQNFIYQEDNSGTHKVDFTSQVDLTGYHEIPKDPEYNINWVYISKSTYEKSLTEVDPVVKYLPIRWFERAYVNVLGYKLICQSKTSNSGESFYKCVPYVKNGIDYKAYANSESIWVYGSSFTEKVGTAGISHTVYPKTETSDERTEHGGGDFSSNKYFPEYKYLER